jgi:hypothetical protein
MNSNFNKNLLLIALILGFCLGAIFFVIPLGVSVISGIALGFIYWRSLNQPGRKWPRTRR